MLRFHKQASAQCTMTVGPVPDPEQCGIAVVDEDQRVVDFEEKPRNPRGNCGFAGIAVAGACLVKALPETTRADLAFDVFPRLRGRMRACRVPGYLGDVGTPGNYRRVEQAWRGLDLPESAR
jgi:NDP-sugar pyrophosphorylase family protein